MIMEGDEEWVGDWLIMEGYEKKVEVYNGRNGKLVEKWLLMEEMEWMEDWLIKG